VPEYHSRQGAKEHKEHYLLLKMPNKELNDKVCDATRDDKNYKKLVT